MKKKILIMIFAVCCVLSIFAACTKPSETQVAPSATKEATVAEEAQDIEQSKVSPTLTDMIGQEVIIPEKVEKIVSLTPAGTESVFAMGQGSKIIGVDAFSNYPTETKDIDIVGDFNGPDVEKIVSLEPDIVLAGMGLQKDAIENLKKMGINVVVVEASKYEDIPTAMMLIGDLIGAPTEAQAIVDNIKKAEEDAKSNASADKKTMYFAMSYGDMGNWSSGPGSFINTMIEIVGAEPTTKDAGNMWVEYQIEDLVTANPDIVMLASDGGTMEGLKSALGYKDLDAIKNDKAYVVDADVLSRPGPRIADAIKMLSDLANK